jgi:hypothetical protein
VLQNYFERPSAQHWFKIMRKRATSIQNAGQLDSIIARLQRSEEFCNTITPTADILRRRSNRRDGRMLSKKSLFLSVIAFDCAERFWAGYASGGRLIHPGLTPQRRPGA